MLFEGCCRNALIAFVKALVYPGKLAKPRNCLAAGGDASRINIRNRSLVWPRHPDMPFEGGNTAWPIRRYQFADASA